MKERDTDVKKQDREVVKRSLESGQPDDPVDVDRFGDLSHSRLSGQEKSWTREEICVM